MEPASYETAASDGDQIISLDEVFAIRNHDAMVEEDFNDSKRELSYEDYYGAESSELRQKKQKLEDDGNGLERITTSCSPWGISSADYIRRKSLPLEILSQTMRQDLCLQDAPAEEWRRQAHIPTMLEEASKIAKASVEAIFADELEQRCHGKSIKRRNSFVIHRSRMTQTTLPQSAFHESLTNMMSSSSTLVDSNGSQASSLDNSQPENNVHDFLVQRFDMPCWRKPVVPSSNIPSLNQDDTVADE